MFSKFFAWLKPQPQAALRPDEERLAVAALLVEAARADEAYTAREKALIDVALADRFALSPCCASDLRVEGEAAQAKANDLHRFTKIVKALPPEHKLDLVESLWRVVLSDGARDPHEDAFIRRVCGLIYVSDPESGAARNRAMKTLGA
jgi:uncharacterized tellurite resistance protein B-like protein